MAVREFIGYVCQDLNLTESVIYEIKNALDEVYINVVEHAYRDHPGPVTIRCYLDDEKLTFIFKDWGMPYDFPKRRRLDLVRIIKDGLSRGLGLPMVYRLMDRVEYRPGQIATEHNEHILEKFISKRQEG